MGFFGLFEVYIYDFIGLGVVWSGDFDIVVDVFVN